MMTNSKKTRGVSIEDRKLFSDYQWPLLKKAHHEVMWLLNRDYPIKSALTFVSNRYLLQKRQRDAILRSVCSTNEITLRQKKALTPEALSGQQVYIDGFNLIITLEVLLSDGVVLHCADGCYRDLAGLRGTYHLIDKTETAIELFGSTLHELGVAKAVVYLDAPISNSGRLKTKLIEVLDQIGLSHQVEVVLNPDTLLSSCNYVISTDAIILNECGSWFNFVDYLIQNKKVAAETMIRLYED